ncbi:hypothetical protein HRI_003242500 [Hibiscus trionum]|uniref:Tf2-1-like SH3-like domain-containing protein n=1 Tax=Hibiscus trionum TaxID=183268 RepID=A0A9W7M9V8_HIBTR|nr:hypothetical protein HRI_003242500 [Hibiscus trionum]
MGVFLKLQPYRQQSVVSRNCHKLSPKWFVPFLTLAKVGKVAYKLQLPVNFKVHHIFHVSQLKERVNSELVEADLPVIGPNENISKEPLMIVDRRIGKRRNRVMTEVLIKWSNSFSEDAT